MNRKQKKVLFRILLSAALLVLLLFLPIEGIWRILLFQIPYLIVGYDILIRAAKGILHLQPFDENFLMAVATLGALALGEYAESVFVMLFYQLGELFQSCAVGKSRNSIRALMDICPDVANVELPSGAIEECSPEEVAVGSILVIRPGERIPIDGVVISGSSALDTVAISGESLPRRAEEGDTAISGCINLTGVLRIRTTKAFEDSTATRILELVENASSKKSRSEHFIAKFARIYTPAVCLGALALALIPPLVSVAFLQLAPAWDAWVYRALTFLVISCPCALVISIPLGFFAGIGGAGRAGILIKGSNYLETLSKVKTVVFDKTGTLTEGNFALREIMPEGMTAEQLLEYSAHAEGYSTHPIAESLRAAYGKKLTLSRVGEVREQRGEGVVALVDGVRVAVGNRQWMERQGASCQAKEQASGTVVYVAVDGVYAGSLHICDSVKESAIPALRAIDALGIKRTVMLTGDRAAAGEAVARELGIREVFCECLPDTKVAYVEQMLSERKKGETLAFVGDGINDAPVLSLADVGIAMGALGSDAAIEAADVVLMEDDPFRIAPAIAIARKCLSIVRQNIWLALSIKLLCMVLGALGIANMWLAIFADVGVMVLAVLNAVRTLRVPNLRKEM